MTEQFWFVLNIAGDHATEDSLVWSTGRAGEHAVPITCEECGFAMARHRDGDNELVCFGCGFGSPVNEVEFPRTEKDLLWDTASALFGCIDCENGEPCRRATWECPFLFRSALDAGIPRSVINNHTKITDHFSREYIASQCGREPVDD